jgi:hypothetical protein
MGIVPPFSKYNLITYVCAEKNTYEHIQTGVNICKYLLIGGNNSRDVSLKQMLST